MYLNHDMDRVHSMSMLFHSICIYIILKSAYRT
jgi:hypothetical protein